MTPPLPGLVVAPAEPTFTVLAFARSTSGFYFGELLAGLNREIGAAGGRVVVVQTLDPGDVADVVVNLPTFDVPLGWDHVTGAVSLSLAADAPYLEALRAAGKPVVLASTRVAGFHAPVALPSNHTGTTAAVEHLIGHGHTRIGFVGNLLQADMHERFAAWRETLQRHGLEHGDDLFVEAPDNAEPGGAAAAERIAAWADRPTAFMVATDRNAIGLLHGLEAAGVRVPQDVAVVGFDNIEAGAFSSPTLSSVSQRFAEVGALAGRMLLDQLAGQEVGTDARCPTSVEIAKRGSCGCTTDLLETPGPSTGAVLEQQRDAAHVAGALWQLQAGTYLRRSQAQERSLTEQFQVASGLLSTTAGDPRDLTWLAGTHVRAGVLALWDGPPRNGRLRVAGTFDPEGALPRMTGDVVRVEQFPPPAMVAMARPDDLEACFVVPVRTHDDYWGLLAVVGDIDTTSSRDTYHYWAALLCSVFEAEALQRAVRIGQERYEVAARAANDGLWEWDLTTDGLYLSERCRDLLGLGAGPVDVDAWYAAVHPEDQAAMRLALGKAMSWRDQPVEVECRVVHPDGEERWALVRGMGVAAGTAPVERVVGSLSDIHQRKELEEQLRQGALFDAVTGLPNRRLFLDRLAWAVEQTQRRDGARFAVVFLDLDGFKLINDSLGHLMGDQLLETIGRRLRSDLRAVDTAARFGGDEFAVLLYDLAPEAVLAVVDRIQEAIAAPVTLGGHEVAVTASVGITTSATGYTSAEDVLRDADIAMYHAKAAERGSASVFDPDMHARATGRLRARTELRTALAEEQFVVHYQPIVGLAGEGVEHFEALVRWQHPERGLLPPGEFLPVMEENGMVVALGHWLLEEVCRQVAAWRTTYPGAVAVSVNVSHREFWADDLLSTVTAALDTHRVAPECLVLEITESVIMADPAAARQTMTDLRAIGVRLHIDDFGTGQSSLHALRTFPVDALKIDGSFIRELGEVEQTTELVRIILDMGRALGLEVVAECVETVAQADHLRGLGCATAQGWLYAKAMPGVDAGALLGRTLGTQETMLPRQRRG